MKDDGSPTFNVDCSSSELLQLPAHIREHTTALFININKFDMSTANWSTFKLLNSLMVSGNKHHTFRKNDFYGLRYLKSLFLNNNNIVTLSTSIY